MYTLSSSKNFQKKVEKIVKQNPILKEKINKTLKLLRKNPKHPSLRLHKLSGRNVWSTSVTKSIRIIIGITGEKIYLLDIGTHDEVY